MKVKIQDFSTDKRFRVVELNRRRAIKEYCLNCSGYSRKDRENCWDHGCDLYPYRTGRGKHYAKARNEAIRGHCREHCMEGHPSYVTDCPSRDCPLYAFRQTKIDKSVEVLVGSRNPDTLQKPKAHRHKELGVPTVSRIEPTKLSLF